MAEICFCLCVQVEVSGVGGGGGFFIVHDVDRGSLGLQAGCGESTEESFLETVITSSISKASNKTDLSPGKYKFNIKSIQQD